MGRARLALAAAVTAALVAACGGSGSGSNGSNGDVLTALEHVASAPTLTSTIKLETTASRLQAMAAASGSHLDAATAGALASAEIVIENAKGGSGNNVDVRVDTGGSTLIELRSLNQSIYLQGDVKGIVALFGKPAVYANLRAQTRSMPSFVQAAIQDRWVSLPAAALSSLASVGGGSSSSGASSGPKLLAALHDVIKRDVSVTASGSDSRGSHYVLSADVRVLARDFQSTLSSAVPGGGLLAQRLPTDIPSRTVHLDAWVKGGALSELSLDLVQFSNSKVPAGASLPLTITFDRSGAPITAPAGAVPVDLTQLGTLFGALTGPAT